MKKLVFLAFFGLVLFSCNNDDETIVCNEPVDLAAEVFNGNEVSLSWGQTNDAFAIYNVEYGVLNFPVGSGTQTQTANNFVNISGLEYETNYQFYVSVRCTDGATSALAGPFSFTTEADNSQAGGNGDGCNVPSDLAGNASSVSGEVFLFWNGNLETAWRVEYGLSGFDLGTGIEINTSSTNINISNLQSEAAYEFYVQANCGSDGFSNFAGPLVLIPN